MTKLTRDDVLRILASDGEAADLSEKDMRGLDLSGLDLSGVNMRKSDLSGADLSGADLSEAILAEANMSGANLTMVDMRWSKLWRAKLVGASLRGATMRGASMAYADMTDADLRWSYGNGGYIRSFDFPGCHVTICIMDDLHVMAIGCQQYSIEEWMLFDDDEIVSMGGKAALHWRDRYKGLLEIIIEDMRT